MSRLIFLDTETGGLDWSNHDLLTAYFAVWEDGVITHGYPMYMKYDRPYRFQPRAMEVNGIDLDKLSAIGDIPLTHKLAFDSWFSAAVGNPREKGFRRATLAGHNVGTFDIPFIRQTVFDGQNFERYFTSRSVDTHSILRAMIDAGILPLGTETSEAAFEYFGITVDGRHTAKGDCLATAKLYDRLLVLMKAGLRSGFRR